MINKPIFFTILFAFSLKANILKGGKHTAAQKQAHDDMANEFGKTLKQALEKSSPVLQGFDFNVAFPTYGMNWTQGRVPELTLKFDLNNESIKVCRFDFKVNSFWEHLTEVLPEESENTAEFRSQVEKCAKQIDEFNNGPTGQMRVAETTADLNQIALEEPDLKDEAEEAFKNVVEKDARELDNGQQDHKGLLGIVRDNLNKIYDNVSKKLAGEKNDQDEESEIDEDIPLPELRRTDDQTVFVLDGLDLNNIPKMPQTTSPEKCSLGMQLILQRRLKKLIIENNLQNVKIFQENIYKCKYAKDY